MYEIKFARLRPDAKIPSKRDEDSDYDLYACFDEEDFIIPALSTAFIPTGIVSALERYLDFTQEGYMTKMTPAQAMKILSVAAQDPGTEATSMTQYSVIYNAQDASATVWLHQDYATAYRLTMD